MRRSRTPEQHTCDNCGAVATFARPGGHPWCFFTFIEPGGLSVTGKGCSPSCVVEAIDKVRQALRRLHLSEKNA